MDISSPIVEKVVCVARLTGTPLPEEELISPNSTVQQWNIGGTDRKRLRDSILSPFFHSYIFAMYKNEALWI